MEHNLEEKCKAVLNKIDQESTAPKAFIAAEMALTLEHLHRSRQTKGDLIKRLDGIKEPIDNRLVNLKRQPTEYSSSIWIDRDKIRGQLMHTKVRLETQRQRVMKEYEQDVKQIEERLLSLLQQYRHLSDE